MMSRYERIQSMTVEELAKYLNKLMTEVTAEDCVTRCGTYSAGCEQCIIDWLNDVAPTNGAI